MIIFYTIQTKDTPVHNYDLIDIHILLKNKHE